MVATHEVVEVVEVGQRAANELLKRGYVLLACEVLTEADRLPRAEGRPGNWFVARFFQYVLGLPESVEEIDIDALHKELAAERAAERAGERQAAGPQLTDVAEEGSQRTPRRAPRLRLIRVADRIKCLSRE